MTAREPLTTPDVDLRDFAFMPLDVVRLRDSDLVAQASDAGFRAAVLLWCAAWHQVPAASLPDDERALAHLSGFGRDLKSWRAVRDEALRNFEKCSDGRLYHLIIAEKAKEAWQKKVAFQRRTAAARAAKAAKATETISVTDDETRHKGQGTGDRGQGQAKATDPDGSAAAAKPPLPPDFRELCEKAAGKSYAKGFGKIAALVEAGVSIEERILPMIRTVADDLAKEGLNVSSWGYFASAIADETREPEAAPPVAEERIWCPLDSPRFAAANRARAKRGDPVLTAVPVPSRGGKGQYFDPRDLAGMDGGGA